MTSESVGNEFEVVQTIMKKFVKDQKHFGFITKDMVEQESKYLEQGKEVKDTIYKDNREMGKMVAGYDDIQLKLQETIANMELSQKRLERAELEEGQTIRKLQLVEEESARVNERLNETIKQLGNAEMRISDNEQMTKIAEVRQITAEEKMEMIGIHKIEAGIIADECQRKYEEVARRLKIVDGELERMGVRQTEANEKIKGLEAEVEEKTIRTKELQAKQLHEAEQDDKMDNKVRDRCERTKLAEMKAEFLDKSIEKLDSTIDSLYDQLLQAKFAFLEVSKNLDANLQDAMEVIDDENPDGVDLTGGFASYMDGVSLKVAQTEGNIDYPNNEN